MGKVAVLPDSAKRNDLFYLGKDGDLLAVGSGTSTQVLGWNSNGEPTAQSLDNSFLANRTRSFYVETFEVAVGTPVSGVQGTNLRYSAWAFDAESTEVLTTPTFFVPRDFVGTLQVFLEWTNLGAGSGNVVWRVQSKVVNAGGDLNATASETLTDNTITAPAQDILMISQHTISLSPAAADHMRLSIGRVGGADTLANDAGLLRVQIAYTADS